MAKKRSIKQPTIGSVRERGNRYVAQVKFPGLPFRAKSFDTAQEAREWCIAEQATHRAEAKHAPKGRAATLGTLVRDYLADPATKDMRDYKNESRLLARFTDDPTLLRDFGPVHIRTARADLNDGKRTSSTVNRYMGALSRAWSFGLNNEYASRPWPRRGVKLKEPPGRTRFLSKGELAELLKAAEKDALIDIALRVSITTGMRQGELLALNWADVDLAKGNVTIQRSKNESKRVVRLGEAGVAALKRLKTGGKVTVLSGPVFLTGSNTRIDMFAFAKRFRPVFKAAGLKDFRWHDLRHTCASWLAQRGATLVEIGSHLGHKSLVSTLRYSHLVQGAPIKGHKGVSDMLL